MEIFRVICIKVVIEVVEVEGFSKGKKKKKKRELSTEPKGTLNLKERIRKRREIKSKVLKRTK